MTVPLPEHLNLCTEFLDVNLTAGRGLKTALLYRDRKFAFDEVSAGASAVGAMLRDLGVEQEQRVLLVLPDVPEFVYAWFGTAKIGAVVSAVSPDLKSEELAYYLDYTRCSAAFVHESAWPAYEIARKKVKGPKVAIAVGEGTPPEGTRPFAELFKLGARCEPALVHQDDMAVWLYTSGSTGFPKGAVHLAHDFLYNALTYAKAVGYGENDVCMGVPKLFFGYALGSNLLFPFRVGGSCALFPERSTPERVLENIARHRVTMLTNVPTMVNGLLGVERARERYDLSSLRWTVSAGEALPAELCARWQEQFQVPIYDGIGSAEMFHIYVSNLPGDVVPGSLGRAVPGYEIQLVDDEGSQVPDGEIGTMRIRGDSMALCYWNRRQQSKDTFQGNWCLSADKFVRDADGRYWYRGRADDLLKVGGRWVAPLEVENALLAHPAVRECAVVGFTDGEGLVKPKAYVVLKPGNDAGDAIAGALKDFVKERIQPYKYPRSIVFVEGLPKNDRGKVDRKQLKS
jgi:benzoate-CoA ligase